MEQILGYTVEEHEIPTELIYAFSKETLKIIQSRQVSSLPDSYWELQNYVETFWRGRRFEYTENSYIVYQMGQLLSFTNMICIMAKEQEKASTMEDYAEQWQDRYCIFKYIHEQKGITHKVLAGKANISVSNLSQFMNKVKWEGFFYCRFMGREKHYYLTEYGEKLYQLMALNNKNHLESEKTGSTVMEKIPKDNNETDKLDKNLSKNVGENKPMRFYIFPDNQLLNKNQCLDVENEETNICRNTKMLNQLSTIFQNC